MFDFSKVEDFDHHIELSIPNYNGLIDVVSAVSLEYLDKDSKLIDIGCSSGRFLNMVAPNTSAELIGCDLVDMKYEKKYSFTMQLGSKVLSIAEDVNVITSLFTLQFMSRKERALTLHQISQHVKKGAIAIIAEKVHLNSTRLNTAIFRSHQRKKMDSFTAVEILEKDHALSGAMFPRSDKEIEQELSSIGNFDQIWQSYNFKCWCIYGV